MLMTEKEIALTEPEVPVLPKRVIREPFVTVSQRGLYFSKAFCEVFSPRRVSITKSGPYIVFREVHSDSRGSYALSPSKNGGAATNTESLMRVINPEGRAKRSKPVPVKGGGWAIKMY